MDYLEFLRSNERQLKAIGADTSGPVVLEQFNPAWNDDIEIMREETSKILTDNGVKFKIMLRGSMYLAGRVPNFPSKPCADMVVLTDTLGDRKKAGNILVNTHFADKRGSHSGVFVERNNTKLKNLHYASVTVGRYDDPRTTDMLLFPEYLLRNPRELEIYKNVKRMLTKSETSFKDYSDKKYSFVYACLLKAREELSAEDIFK